MKLVGLTIENFRCYEGPTSVRFNDLTALVGRNDVGKSTLMEALGIFFDVIKPDKDDACKSGDPKKMRIVCEFSNIPSRIIVDTNFETTLAAENLLSPTGTLIIQKTYNGSLGTPTLTSINALAEHPTAAGYNDLLSLKKTDLAKRASDLGVNLDDIDKRVNSLVRNAIWGSCDNLQKNNVEVSLDAEGGKQVWASLQPYLPTFALFKSDRASTDQDAEAQDPLKAAIREACKVVEADLQAIQSYIETEVKKIAEATVEKLREMDPSLAETLNPVISTKKWDSLFSTSITGDEGIPLNKRGSGVKRLVLLNFFRAKAEKDALSKSASSVIYAIEEPETSQHPRNQRLLLNALRDLSTGDGRQVVVTTHTPMLARYLNEDDLRFIRKNGDGVREIIEGNSDTFGEISKSLGVLPDHNVKIFVGVEGPHDITFLKGIAKVLISAGEDIPDLDRLELDGELIFVPLGGSNLALWASRLSPINRPEFHICDRDNEPPKTPKYIEHINAINARPDCYAVATQKRELESYLHPEAITECYAKNDIQITFSNIFADFDDVPSLVAKAVHEINAEKPWNELDTKSQKSKESTVKKRLNDIAVRQMTAERLNQTDRDDEIRGWLREINRILEIN